MKVKAKLKKDTVKVKALFKSPMAGREEAEKKNQTRVYYSHYC